MSRVACVADNEQQEEEKIKLAGIPKVWSAGRLIIEIN